MPGYKGHLTRASDAPQMNDRICVGTTYRQWWFELMCLGTAALLIGGIVCLAVEVPAGKFLVVASLACLVLTFAARMAIAAGRRWLEVTPEGFTVFDNRGRRDFTDEEVLLASLAHKSNYSSGELKSVTRTFTVWAGGTGPADKFKMVNRLRLGTVDPLYGFIERILALLVARARADLDAGRTVDGEGWTLLEDELLIYEKPQSRLLRISELTAADVVDRNVCVWRVGQDEPAARFPVASANSHVLIELLRGRIAQRQPEQAGADGGLGRLLFERKSLGGGKAALWLVLVITLLVAGPVGAAGVANGIPSAQAAAAALLALGGLVGFGLYAGSVVFRCHAAGISKRRMGRTTVLRYSDIDSFTYAAVKMHYHGAYCGTMFRLAFDPRPGSGAGRITFNRSLQHPDDELENLRGFVSRTIAARMAAAFAEGCSVSWTARLQFLPQGLEFSASRIFGKGKPIVIPYERIGRFDIDAGKLQLWTVGQSKPMVKEEMSQPNFFPGLEFLTTLCASRAVGAVAQTAPLEPSLAPQPG